MRNDDHRTNENSWNERKQEDSVDDDRLEEEDERRNEVPARRSSDDELEKAFGEGRALADNPPEDMIDLVAEAISVHGWSGILPDSESFAMYPDDVQKRMVAWNDAKIIDESARLDKLTDANIKQTKIESILSFVLNFSFVAIAFIAFIVTKDIASFGFLSIPGITIVINGISDIRSGKK